MLNIADRAAREAAKIILQAQKRLDEIQITPKGRHDFATDIDILAERAIVQIIQQAYPNHGIIAEESGEVAGDEYQWIIDPIDGTTNFIHGYPYYAISIAIFRHNRPAYALIFDPNLQESFTAIRGKGARMNATRIRVSNRKNLSNALLSTDFPRRQTEVSTSTFRELYNQFSGIRRSGSIALDLAYLACGRLDACWIQHGKIWDFAAGALLIQEAGGMVSDLQGSENYLKNGQLLASNRNIFKQLLPMIAKLN